MAETEAVMDSVERAVDSLVFALDADTVFIALHEGHEERVARSATGRARWFNRARSSVRAEGPRSPVCARPRSSPGRRR